MKKSYVWLRKSHYKKTSYKPLNKKRQYGRRRLFCAISAVCLLFGITFFSTQHLFDQLFSQMCVSCFQPVCAASDKKVIVLDAGHGGEDPGTLWESTYEKNINLEITTKLEKILQRKGYSVIMTRNNDTAVSLESRIQLAENSRADVFVSIHQNALENDTVTNGIEVYCNENSNQNSSALAFAVQRAVIQATGATDLGADSFSNFYVVRENSVPACLIETGFLTSSMERSLLLSEEYQQKIASGIADGIHEYLQMQQTDD